MTARLDPAREKRSNATHASVTEPDARLHTKAPGAAAMLCFMGHTLMENRNGLVVQAGLTRACGHGGLQPREAAETPGGLTEKPTGTTRPPLMPQKTALKPWRQESRPARPTSSAACAGNLNHLSARNIPQIPRNRRAEMVGSPARHQPW